jgi:hypothetical protein
MGEVGKVGSQYVGDRVLTQIETVARDLVRLLEQRERSTMGYVVSLDHIKPLTQAARSMLAIAKSVRS